MIYWGGGDGETGRGRRALGLEVTWVLPQLPAISKTCVTPKEVFCIHFSIFQVDQLSPSASGGGWEHSRGPWTACCFAGPSRELGGQGTVTWTGESHWGPGGAGGSGLTAGVGTTQFPAPGYLNTIHRYGRERWDYTTCHWSAASGPVTSQAEASQGPSMPQEVRLPTPIESL